MVILMKKITYIFSKGRINRLNNDNYAEDFFYGARFLLNKGFNVQILEFNNINSVKKKIEYYLSKLVSLPLYIFSITNKENYRKLKETDYLVLISESAGFASLLLLILLKKRYKITTYLFVMGLYSKEMKFKFFNKTHKFLIKLLEKYIDHLFFLGIEELNYAIKEYGSSKKYSFLPFHIDTNFWFVKHFEINKNNKILFIGNDGNRDYNLLIDIVTKMPDHEFIIVTSNQKVLESNLENVEYINGSWDKEKITDLELKKVYSKAKLVILHLKETFQPSGQSVALQAMSIGVPVLISKTIGFWDRENFIDNENIFFIDNDSPDEWKNKIEYLINEKINYEEISKNAKQIIKEKYSISNFENKLLKELE